MFRSITEVPCVCMATLCDWQGLTGECEPDEEGCLRCPLCSAPVEMQYTDHERSPSNG